ncbi:mechanosensitive ion channel family protein [candidate division TA06 bacterium]|uniref:Mechanosensitive ion channel family protein n=1 Tax=candidate division TA06 bacterium TaxID=2250710 RepID=A0A933MIC1_UNCT6|nr:mechanosensitive ion channel family protein [candidate division TA06 bacterium]
MKEFFQQLPGWLKSGLALKGLILLGLGFFAAQVLARMAEKAAAKKSEKHTAMMIGKVVYYAVIVLVLAAALDIFNVKLTAILAAAGIMSVALGFAAQTSVANIVSGFFLLMDRPFEIDDVIDFEGQQGTVTSIDLLSTKLRTFDNLYVRIPNENLIKNKIVNLTRYKTRRLCLHFKLGPETDIAAAKKIILDAARGYQHTLADPHPFTVVQGFGESGTRLDLFLWVKGEAYLQSLSDLNENIRRALLARGIRLAFPHREIINKS